jgi:molybdopterin-guanine dinucleotide biosynthesis protein A
LATGAGEQEDANMDAVLLAGGIPQPDEPLYADSGGEAKALMDVAGKPMVQWVLDALGGAKSIERIVVIGLSEKSKLPSKKPITYMSNQGKLLDNLKAGTAKILELNPKTEKVLFVSSDIPALTSEMVDWLVKTCSETDDDLYYNVVRRQDMERRFPGSKRTYTRLKELEVCGGDMNMARASIVNEHSEFWNKLIEARKNPAAQAALIGPDIIFKYLFRQLTIDDVIRRVAQKLGLKGRAIVCPYPEIGMDVDKPHQLEIMRADLARRSRRTAPGSGMRSSKSHAATRGAKKAAPKKPTAKAKARPAKKTTRRAKS